MARDYLKKIEKLEQRISGASPFEVAPLVKKLIRVKDKLVNGG